MVPTRTTDKQQRSPTGGDQRSGCRTSYSSKTESGAEYTILDEGLEVVDESVTTVSPIRHTDSHDFRVLPNGNYLLIAYESKKRNLTALPFMDPTSTSVTVRDSVIQMVTPTDRAVMTWNSFDHMALEDCVQHRFPLLGPGRPPPGKTNPGYAHLNSVRLADGVIVGSFRGCSKVLGIDAGTGEVLWRVGRSNLTEVQWDARDIGPAPMSVIDDPLGEFCGQHTASILPNGNLLLYDNGVVCVVDPSTSTFDQLGRAGEDYSRAVEYALDYDNNEAVYVREHPMTSAKDTFALSTGGVELLDNGDWLISWGRPDQGRPPLEVDVTRVDPSTGQVKFEIAFTDDYKTSNPRSRINAVAVPAEALAPQPAALTAALPSSDHSSVFHTGATDSPQVVVAFSRPVVDFDAASPSLSVSGATVASVSAHVVSGEAANAYLVTLIPDGDAAITFGLVADQACDAGGICAADGTTLSEVPAALVIGPPPSVSFERAAYSVDEGGAVDVAVRLSTAHRGARAVTVPVLAGSGSASAGDFTAEQSVDFEAGETRKTLSVGTSHDDLVEGPETITLEFGTLPDDVTAGSTPTSTVTISDADTARVRFAAEVAQVSEGGEVDLGFAITNGVTFERDQTITLTVGGTATPGDDFEVVHANAILAAPYTIPFPAEATSVAATVRALDDTVVEAADETVTISARLVLTNASLGTVTVTIPPSDVPDTPLVTIAPGSGITEGEDASFTLSRTDASNVPLTSALTVRIQATATTSTLSGPPPSTATFDAGSSTAVVEVATLDNTVIDGNAAVTVLVRGSSANPPVYLTGTGNTATVAVADNDTAAFTVTAGAVEVSEGAPVRVVVELVDVTFAAAQTLTLALGGTATPGEDFTITDPNSNNITNSQRFVLPAGARSVSLAMRAETDSEDDAGETVEITVFHGSSSIGAVTVTITETAPPTITSQAGGGGGGGAASPLDPLGEFSDLDEAGVHTDAVVDLVTKEILARTGCRPGRLCPNEPIRRWEVAVWLIRVLTGDDPGRPNRSRFEDVRAGQWWAGHVEHLARMRITLGCSTEPRLFCPNEAVTRAQMASFLTRAFELAQADPAGFDDVADTGHDADVDALHAAGITVGCSSEPLLYCPQQPTTRAQMASLLTRAVVSREPGWNPQGPRSHTSG